MPTKLTKTQNSLISLESAQADNGALVSVYRLTDTWFATYELDGALHLLASGARLKVRLAALAYLKG